MSTFADASVLVHIGLHKTANSWLQTHLFAHEEHGFFTPWRQAGTPKRASKTIAQLICYGAPHRLIDEDEFDAGAVRKRLAAIEVPDGRQPIVSGERLGGHPLSGGFDRKILCRRLREVFPSGRVLIVIREQHAIILSNYMQYLRYGGWHTIERYIHPPSDGRQPVTSPRFWCYDRLITLYREAFGADSVLVLPYEMFHREPADFVSRICEFAGIPSPLSLPWQHKVNVRRGHFSSYYLRRMTRRFRPSSANGYYPALMGGLLGKKIDSGIKKAVQAVVPGALETMVERSLRSRLDAALDGDCFRLSNRRTMELTGLDLDKFGYRL